ncbi:MAG TPA: TadE family protein [Stellaceae bacterium]|nr:TadE family protein [Stellaceae bacterium]
MIRHIGRRQDGVTMIEFALLLPFFIVLLFGIIEFAQAVFVQAALQHAVTESARCYSLFQATDSLGSANTPPDCSTMQNVRAVASQQAYGLSIAASIFTPTTQTGYACVSASYPMSFGVPFLPRYALTLAADSCYPTAPTGSR